MKKSQNECKTEKTPEKKKSNEKKITDKGLPNLIQ